MDMTFHFDDLGRTCELIFEGLRVERKSQFLNSPLANKRKRLMITQRMANQLWSELLCSFYHYPLLT